MPEIAPKAAPTATSVVGNDARVVLLLLLRGMLLLQLLLLPIFLSCGSDR